MSRRNAPKGIGTGIPMSMTPMVNATANSGQVDTRSRGQKLLDRNRADRNRDMEEGRRRGEQVFGEGMLGRVDAARSQEVGDVLARRRENLAGFTPEEQNALREQNMTAINQASQGQMRQLRAQQASAGVRGPAALAQQNAMMQGAQGQMTQAERDLFIKNAEMKRGALDSLEQSIGSARSDELSRQQFNIGQQNKEKYGQISSELGFASLGSSDRAAVAQQLLGEKQLKVAKDMANQYGESGKK